VNKKLIIIVSASGLVSFVTMFIVAWLTKPSAEIPSTEAAQTTSATEEPILKLPQPQVATASTADTIDSNLKKAMTEKQLKSLVYEVREKIQEYDSKLESIKLREQRLQIAGDTLKKDIERLDNLRIKLALTIASLKTERDKLLKSRVEIAKIEKNNLIAIAATYDKMASEAAGQILINISQTQDSSADDAIKILYYMSERTKAKVLASIAETEPAISAYFCKRLKQIVEEE